MLPRFRFYLKRKLSRNDTRQESGLDRSSKKMPGTDLRTLRESSVSLELNDAPRPLIGEVISTVQSQVSSMSPEKHPESKSTSEQGDSSSGAHDFVMMNPVMYHDSRHYNHAQNYNFIMAGQPVLERLMSAGTPEARLDAAARYPLPRCYPGARKTIQEKLLKWLNDGSEERRTVWLFGSAGVGKSAVAQTFAEAAKATGLLAGAYFFSSTHGEKSSSPLRLIPTLAYQLSTHDTQYKNIITQKLASDPSILDATLEAQFRGLIVDPFLQLSSYGVRVFEDKRRVIIIDGLDECNDDVSQCELVELIMEAAQKDQLPLIWLICSRSERHLKSTFSQLEYVSICSREELQIDSEARSDVELFLRARFTEIRTKFPNMVKADARNVWPTERDFRVISRAADGHFVVASVAEKYVGDRVVRNPEAQLGSLVNILRGLSNAGVNNPLEALDAFYTRILGKVPERAWPVVGSVLALSAYHLDLAFVEELASRLNTTEQLWIFLGITQYDFYSAMETLHSVLDVPSPEDARNKPITFYHKSFPDYLMNERRSGKFSVYREQVYLCYLACVFNRLNITLQAGRSKRRNADKASIQYYRKLRNDLRFFYRFRLKPVSCSTRGSTLLHVLQGFSFDLMSFDEFDSGFNVLPMFAISLIRDPRLDPHFFRTDIKVEIIDSRLLNHLSLLTDGKSVEPLDLTASDPFVRRYSLSLTSTTYPA
ncbi:hypothetical protein NP233_g1813 [Leucocoprinus birnbaumii]|uniref:Nephrocystin 3-like N-terminal domain-containing protein n=1 Tax=Leucocoprinus birnbaumii TaxID=56174 RepID=A0AAD5W081_9AGAR|nr:hypothetical protein NP233_g1813 [Leucocoprinus birnbaumii]